MAYKDRQVAFHYYQSSSPSNVTGDGTVYTLNANTKIVDVGNNFNNSTFTFTAPYAGNYNFFMAALLSGVGVQTTLQLQIITATDQYNGAYINPATTVAAGAFLGQNMAVMLPLAAADTITFCVVVSGGTKTVGVTGGIGLTYVGGYLVY